jgi:hypothetical protein
MEQNDKGDQGYFTRHQGAIINEITLVHSESFANKFFHFFIL